MYSIAQAISQTITSASLPVVGTIWIEFIDTTAGNISIPTAGPAQNWNYGTSFNVADTSGINFVAMSTAPAYMNLSTLFPNASAFVKGEVSDSIATPVKFNTNGFFIDGVYDHGLLNDPQLGLNLNHIDFNPDRLLIPTPFSLNSTRNNTAKYQIVANIPNVATITVKTNFIQSFIADGTGTLTTPLGQFNNVLSVKQTSYSVDSTTYNPPIQPAAVQYSDTIITYSFLNTVLNCLLMTIDVNATTNQPVRASYFDPVTNSGIAEDYQLPVTMYPNPATDIFYLNHVRNNSSISIHDMTGKEVNSKFLGGYESTIMINTSDVPAGLYIMKLYNSKDGAYFVNKFQVIK